MITWPQFIARAVMVPFVPWGRDYDGWDCWGLVHCAYRDVLGKDIPRFDSRYIVGDERSLIRTIAAGKNQFVKLTETDGNKIGAIALIVRAGTEPSHCGLLMDGQMILHADASIGTVQDHVSRFRIESLYDWA